jgi:cobyrinic acid a,c-diamide synthase
MNELNCPRVVVAGPSSGVGKTTAVVAIVRALRARGLDVAVFKCGPDYLDPTYHARAAGRASHNLDGWMMGREAVQRTFVRATEGADIAVVEGVMGLFDGASPTGEEGSTAEIAKWLGAPVLLVVDASGMARTIAAVARGFVAFDPDVRVGGLICNRVGSRGHLDLLRRASTERPVLGGLPVQAELAFPERHLGLLTATEGAVPDATLEAWGGVASQWLGLDAIVDLARSAPAIRVSDDGPRALAGEACRIGLAWDDAFHFYYDDNLSRLKSLGATLVRFSPIRDAQVPNVDGLYFGGGYPEVHAHELANNRAMRESIAAFAQAGGPIYAECGGLMYLSRAIRTRDDRRHAMVGLLPVETIMQDRLAALGYVEVETQVPTILGPPGLRFRGHQFRYSELGPADGPVQAPYTVRRRRDGKATPEGFVIGQVVASYVHAHWASNPRVAEAFVRSCAGRRS